MALGPVGNGPTLPPSQTTAPKGPVKLGVDGNSKAEDIGKALNDKFQLKDGSGPAFAKILGEVQSSSSRSAVLKKVEANVNEFIKKNPNATPDQIATEAKKHLTAQTLMTKHIEKSITDMASKSIERIKDTFSDS